MGWERLLADQEGGRARGFLRLVLAGQHTLSEASAMSWPLRASVCLVLAACCSSAVTFAFGLAPVYVGLC